MKTWVKNSIWVKILVKTRLAHSPLFTGASKKNDGVWRVFNMSLFQMMLSEKLLRQDAFQKPRYPSFLTPLFLIVIASFSTASLANTVSGELNFLDASGAVTTTYQGGDSVVLQVVDGDRNGDPSTADSITVLLTSTTEDTGTPASASEPVAGE